MSTSWYSSMSRASVSCDTMLPLPRMTRSGPSVAFNACTWATRSPLSTVVFCQSAASSVRDTTYLGIAFIALATSGSIWAACGVGQKAFIIS